KCEKNGDSDVPNTFLKQAQTLAIILTFTSNAFNFALTFTFIRRIYPTRNSYAFTSAFSFLHLDRSTQLPYGLQTKHY
uniref:Uncharacterized protein n=1 Tax=Echinococcus canadensis TaxID=519352 RepID=A0A915EXM5_9CEST